MVTLYESLSLMIMMIIKKIANNFFISKNHQKIFIHSTIVWSKFLSSSSDCRAKKNQWTGDVNKLFIGNRTLLEEKGIFIRRCEKDIKTIGTVGWSSLVMKNWKILFNTKYHLWFKPLTLSFLWKNVVIMASL